MGTLFMRRLVKLSLIVLVACSSGAFAADTTMRDLSDADILKIIRDRIELDKQSLGIVVGIIDQTGTRTISYGYANEKTGAKVDQDSIFEIGSLTKLFTSLILADMAVKGELDVNDSVAKFLPKNVVVPGRHGRQISLLDLSLHRSGLPRLPTNFKPVDQANPYADYTVDNMYEFLSSYTLPRDVGEKIEYSNFAVGLLGHALSLKAGMSFETLVRTRITNVLDMNNTGIALTPAMQAHLALGHDSQRGVAHQWDLPTLAGAGALRSSVRDMLKFLAENMSPKNAALTPAITLMQSPQDGTRRVMAWGRRPPDGFTHDGGTGGYASSIAFDKARQRGVVILSNMETPVGDIATKIMNSSSRLVQFVPPKEFVQALEKGGYQHAKDVYTLFRKKSQEFYLDEQATNLWAYALLGDGKIKQAVNIFELNVSIYPNSVNAYESLAEGFEAFGDVPNAILNYKKCLALADGNSTDVHGNNEAVTQAKARLAVLLMGTHQTPTSEVGR